VTGACSWSRATRDMRTVCCPRCLSTNWTDCKPIMEDRVARAETLGTPRWRAPFHLRVRCGVPHRDHGGRNEHRGWDGRSRGRLGVWCCSKQSVAVSGQERLTRSRYVDRFRRLCVSARAVALHARPAQAVARTAACTRLHSVERGSLAVALSEACGTDIFPMPHEMLANMLGTGRPFVTRTAETLQPWRLIAGAGSRQPPAKTTVLPNTSMPAC